MTVSTLNLIKLITAKQGKIESTSKWNVFKQYELKKSKEELLTEFFSRDIFEQSNALFGIIMNFYAKTPEIIPVDVTNRLRITDCAVDILFDVGNTFDGIQRDGIVRYTPSKEEFEVDIEPNPNMNDGYRFTYSKNIELSKINKDRWNNELLESIESIYMDLLLCIVSIINSPMYAAMTNKRPIDQSNEY